MMQCCCEKGPIDFRVYFDKDVVTSVDKLTVNVMVDLTHVSSGSIDSITIKLKKYLTAVVRQGKSKSYSDTLIETRLPGVAARAKTETPL